MSCFSITLYFHSISVKTLSYISLRMNVLILHQKSLRHFHLFPFQMSNCSLISLVVLTPGNSDKYGLSWVQSSILEKTDESPRTRHLFQSIAIYPVVWDKRYVDLSSFETHGCVIRNPYLLFLVPLLKHFADDILLMTFC